jgi:hypothetical protein
MAIAKTYYKVTCAEEHDMAGAGLGYEEIYGDGPRFFWDQKQAKQRAVELNAQTASDNGAGTYTVQARHAYDDGSWDDLGNLCARVQLCAELMQYAASQIKARLLGSAGPLQAGYLLANPIGPGEIFLGCEHDHAFCQSPEEVDAYLQRYTDWLSEEGR